MGIASLNAILRGVVFTGGFGVLVWRLSLSLTLSLKGEGTVGQTLMFWSQPASTETAG